VNYVAGESKEVERHIQVAS